MVSLVSDVGTCILNNTKIKVIVRPILIYASLKILLQVCGYSVSHLLLLIDFSLTVKAATLIFISWSGSAISSAMEGK